MKTAPKLQTFISGFLICVLLTLGTSSEEDEEKQAIEKAIEETSVIVEQLSFEKKEEIFLRLEMGEKLVAEGKVDEAEAEFKAVIEIAPDEKRALAYLRDIGDIREKATKEAEKRKRFVLLKEGKEREKVLAEIRAEKRKAQRESKILKRRKIRTREQQIDEYIRQGKEYYGQGGYAKAIEEWQKALELTHPSDHNNQRMLNWISAAKVAEQRRKDETARTKKKELEELARLHVKEAWSVEEVEPEKRREEERAEFREEISPATLRLQEKARQLITVTFNNAHLREVVGKLSELTQINIVLDDSVLPGGEEEIMVPAPAPVEERPVRDLPPGIQERMPGFTPGVEEGVIPPAPAALPEEIVAPSLISARVTVQLKDIPLIDALDVILRTKGLDYRLEQNVIYITTVEKLQTGKLVTKSYRPSGGLGDIEDMLRATVPFDSVLVEGGGVEGPEGSNISVDRTSGTIFITNTSMNHRLAEDIIRQLATAPPQVSIETRFIDIEVAALTEFGIQLGFPEPFEGLSSDAYIGGTTFGSDGKPISGPGIDLGVSQSSSGAFMTYTKLTPTEFSAMMQMFEETRKGNLLSAPRITVVSNYTGLIHVVRPYPYVESYSITERTIEISGDDFRISTAVPDIALRDVGVLLEVTPGIGADRKVINLTLAPQVVQLVDESTYQTATSELTQPVFSVRSVTTNVDINDGETLVLGGLIRGEEGKTVRQIPFLGSIPILGSLFRSKEQPSQERELLIFVTATILEPTGQPLIRD